MICSTIDGRDLESDVMGDLGFDEESGAVDLTKMFTVRRDDGSCYSVHGWLVDVTVIEPEKVWVM